MNSTQTNQDRQQRRNRVGHTRAVLALAALCVLSFAAATDTLAQKGFSKKYPTRKNVRLLLSNLFGTVEVQTWNRDEIKVSADMYPPIAPFTPEQSGDTLVIKVRNDSHGGGEVGDINFRITVPVNSSVDIETRRGNISVRGVQGEKLRAKVYGSGEIELSEIGVSSVIAETITGNIFFEGRLLSGGKYDFQTVKGDVTIRIPEDSAFSLMAAAPTTRKINLGMFANPNLNLSDGRKVWGNVGDGRCALVILNQQGSITFVRR